MSHPHAEEGERAGVQTRQTYELTTSTDSICAEGTEKTANYAGAHRRVEPEALYRNTGLPRKAI